MAFGKKGLARQPELLERLRDNLEDELVHQTEEKMTRGDAPRWGRKKEPECGVCHKPKADPMIVRTGMCKECTEEWGLYA